MHSRKKAFSLYELQIALVIGILTLTAAACIYIFYWRTFIIGNDILDVYTNSRVAEMWMARDIRSAAQVVPSYSTYTTTDHSIVLQVPSVHPQTGDMIPSHYDYIVYKLQGSDLYRIVIPDSLSARTSGSRATAHYCASLLFSSEDLASHTIKPLSEIPNLSTINSIGMYLPLNKTTVTLGGGATGTVSITPTTVIRLRNK